MNERSVSGDRMIPAPGDVWEGDGSARGFTRDVAVEDGHRSGLTHYVMILRKRKWLIVSTTAIALLIGLVATLLAEPVYTARATFEVQREAPRVLDVNSVEADNKRRRTVLPDPVRPDQEPCVCSRDRPPPEARQQSGVRGRQRRPVRRQDRLCRHAAGTPAGIRGGNEQGAGGDRRGTVRGFFPH